MIDLNKYSQEIHENAVKHGWWESPREFGEIIALIHSELSEALEEYRKYGEAAEKMVYYSCGKNANIAGECDGKCGKCQYGKPEGIAVELIDAVIRILDWFGSENEQIADFKSVDFNWSSFGCFISDCHESISLAYTHEDDGTKLFFLFGCMSAICVYLRAHNIDPETVMREKMDYNATRPYRHGGKKL